MQLRVILWPVLLLACLAPARAQDVPQFPVDIEKRVTVHASYGFQQQGKWLVPLRLWVHEEPDTLPWLVAETIKNELADTAGIEDLTSEQEEYFRERAFAFVADSESGESPILVFRDDPKARQYSLTNANGDTETDRNGLLEGYLTLELDEARELLDAQKSMDGWLVVDVVSEDHFGQGRIRLVDSHGLSVISDIDDTIKVTEIPAGDEKVIYNTFFKELMPTSCMPTLYQQFAASVPFHYVSGAPWQLYGPIAGFVMDAAGHYPAGSFHMKNVRTNIFESESYSDIFKLIGGSGPVTFEQKITQISALLRHFPERQFVLIGDSGEGDPEVFSQIRAEFPEQVQEILIRDVVGDALVRPERFNGMSVIPPTFASDEDCADWATETTAPYR